MTRKLKMLEIATGLLLIASATCVRAAMHQTSSAMITQPSAMLPAELDPVFGQKVVRRYERAHRFADSASLHKTATRF